MPLRNIEGRFQFGLVDFSVCQFASETMGSFDLLILTHFEKTEYRPDTVISFYYFWNVKTSSSTRRFLMPISP